MTALNMAAGTGPLRRLAAFRMTLGARVALTFAALFLIFGALFAADDLHGGVRVLFNHVPTGTDHIADQGFAKLHVCKIDA